MGENRQREVFFSMKRSAITALLLLTLLLLTACGSGRIAQGVTVLEDNSALQQPAGGGADDTQPSGGQQPAGGQPASDPQQPAGDQPAQPGETPSLFAQMPAYYSFSSGAGAWSTDIEISGDGSFTGGHHDSDMGDLDEDLYPNGTVYYCNFSGQFTQPEKVDEHTYTMRLTSLTAEGTEGTMEFEDGVRYIVSSPYGLEEADEVRILLPGTPMNTLPEDMMFWLIPYIYGDMPEELPFYVLYNVNEQYAFVGYDG